MSKQLPERPSLDQLKKQAKDLLDEIRAGETAARARAGFKPDDAAAADAFALHDAQRVVAREYGFASWPALKLHVETRAVDAAEARLIEAALEGEHEVIGAILKERPALATRSIFASAALGDERAVADAVKQNPAAAKIKGGPRDWEPLLYVCFGQAGGNDTARTNTAKALLAAGADPNASWRHADWPDSPLPALYGSTGVNNYPQLARVLLEAGANPHDGESRYHAAEHNHVACLEVLREFGTDFSGADKTWGNTPLAFLLGYAYPTPGVREGIRWILDHGADPNVRSHAKTLNQTALHVAIALGWDAATVRLLLQHGADVTAKRADGRTAYALAIRSGREELVALLREHGASAEAAPRDEFLGYCMRGDAGGAKRLLDAHPDLLATLSVEDRKLPIMATKKGDARTVETFGRVGFDLAAEGDWGEHPLHWAAWHGRAEVVRALIASGVPLEHRDKRFNAPPLGWCAHGSLHGNNPAGDYGAVAEALLAAGVAVDGAIGNAPVMAAIKRHVAARATG